MAISLIGDDIKLMRDRYDEALVMRGIACKYQFPVMADTNVHGEPVIDHYSDFEDTHIFFDGSPKVKTFKRYGWVVENDKDLPFLIHCSFHLQQVQRDSLFTVGGMQTDLPPRVFRVTELTYSLECPDHIICQVVPKYDKQTVGRTDKEIEQTYNKSNKFLKPVTDYRGHYHTTKEDLE